MERVTVEKSLADVLGEVWLARGWMLFFAVSAVIFAFLFLTLANPYIRAEMIVAPATPIGNHPQATPDFEGIIELQTGVMTGSAAFTRFENIYNGVSVARMLIQDEKILAGLRDDLPFRFSDSPDTSKAETLAHYLKKHLKLEPVGSTPLRRLAYLHPDRDFAVYLIGRVHRITDEMIRVSILQEVNGRIDYLGKALARTQNADHRRALTELLMEQERLKMLVSLDQPYAAAIVEPPAAGIRTAWPDRYLIFGGSVIVGLLIGYIFFGLRTYAHSG